MGLQEAEGEAQRAGFRGRLACRARALCTAPGWVARASLPSYLAAAAAPGASIAGLFGWTLFLCLFPQPPCPFMAGLIHSLSPSSFPPLPSHPLFASPLISLCPPWSSRLAASYGHALWPRGHAPWSRGHAPWPVTLCPCLKNVKGINNTVLLRPCSFSHLGRGRFQICLWSAVPRYQGCSLCTNTIC